MQNLENLKIKHEKYEIEKIKKSEQLKELEKKAQTIKDEIKILKHEKDKLIADLPKLNKRNHNNDHVKYIYTSLKQELIRADIMLLHMEKRKGVLEPLIRKLLQEEDQIDFYESRLREDIDDIKKRINALKPFFKDGSIDDPLSDVDLSKVTVNELAK